jgi:hypothetical protein
MNSNKPKTAFAFLGRIFLRTFLRFNPFYKPIIPGLFTIYILSVIFTGLYLCDMILCTFIIEYREIAISAWGFLVLLNLMEAIAETYKEFDEEV